MLKRECSKESVQKRVCSKESVQVDGRKLQETEVNISLQKIVRSCMAGCVLQGLIVCSKGDGGEVVHKKGIDRLEALTT